MENLTVTSIADLEKYKEGTVVRFPDFAEGQPFVARVRRPSMLVMAKSGKIPNTLLVSAAKLFTGDTRQELDEGTLSQIYDVCKIICEATLLQPTLAEIEGAGMELTDDQITAIFNYTQSGVKALNSFR